MYQSFLSPTVLGTNVMLLPAFKHSEAETRLSFLSQSTAAACGRTHRCTAGEEEGDGDGSAVGLGGAGRSRKRDRGSLETFLFLFFILLNVGCEELFVVCK
eukprot:TRINITY_DN28005_c0_g2_i2.p1 TRINITY_DN28005_c0_g2~~TRINITY_DN28005_c0_g2_i2.p1  ORF type:complete len:101 (+),score=10.53 TRINITY_DN28005_c0_g2_i2:480-782(+)